MQYPKPTMRLTVLVKEGYHSKQELLDIYTAPGQTVARKQNPYKRTSPILFDTDKLGKLINQRCKLSNAR